MDTRKTCTSCFCELPLEAFYKSIHGKDGRETSCSNCRRLGVRGLHERRETFSDRDRAAAKYLATYDALKVVTMALEGIAAPPPPAVITAYTWRGVCDEIHYRTPVVFKEAA